jgi:tetratricopeptide (TPR) repeat protein
MSNVSSSNFYLRLLGASLLALSACSARGEAVLPKTSNAGAEAASSANTLAEFAMAYQPEADEAGILAGQEAVRKAPKDAMAYLSLAESFLVRKRETANARYFALASNAMSAARVIAPRNTKVRTSAVQLLFSDHRFAEAAEETRKLIAIDASNATAHLLLSDALVEQGEYDKAVDALEDANDISPDLRVYARGSYLRWIDGDQEGAIELMVDAIKMGSLTKEAVAWCYVELGMLYWHANDMASASKAADRALTQLPDYPATIELQARIAASEGKQDEAIVLYQKLVQRRSTVAAFIALSELLEMRGRAAEARAARASAEEGAVHDPLALALHDARYGLDPKSTLKLAKQAVEERSNIYTRDAHALALSSGEEPAYGTLDASIWVHRALIQAAAKDSTAASASLKKALAINPMVDAMLVAEIQATLTKDKVL